jgi:hypothetical protein
MALAISTPTWAMANEYQTFPSGGLTSGSRCSCSLTAGKRRKWWSSESNFRYFLGTMQAASEIVKASSAESWSYVILLVLGSVAGCMWALTSPRRV